MNRKIRILIITYLPWREDNNIGNSYSNIFKGTDDRYEFAHIYARDGMPQNRLCKEYYHISEKKLIKSIIKRSIKVGEYFHIEDAYNTPKDTFSKAYNFARLLRWHFFLLIRELCELNNTWKTKELDDFIDMFNPDIVFGTMPDEALTYRLMAYVKKKKNIPVVTYPWDDYYSLDHNSLNPFFWIRKFMSRHFLRKSASISSFLYVITNVMKEEYEINFRKECKLLFKGHVFENNKKINFNYHAPINLVYMGNIGQGRWKTLANLAVAIKEINSELNRQVFVLNVYTLSPKSREIVFALNIDGTSQLKDAVPNEDVKRVMDEADILVHAEPFKKSEFQFYRASFSTKLVDYFYSAKPILAIGGLTASTDYLKRNNAAICITDKTCIVSQLKTIANTPEILSEYAQRSWDCGVRNHQINDIQERIYNDFIKLIENGNKES